jgi:AraC-like DNA-binding protein/quercetin dioxygenase-like cupin family protein
MMQGYGSVRYIQSFSIISLLVIEKLEQYSEDERYYRRWYELRDDPKSLLAYADSYGDEEITRRYLIHPRDLMEDRKMRGKEAASTRVRFHLENGTVRLDEDHIFNRDPNFKNRNVVLMKHNRYSPFFEHFHSYFETFFVLSGSCTNTIGGRRLQMTAGQLCFIAPNIHHSLTVFDDSIVINIIIRKSSFDEIFFNLLTANDILSRFFLGNLCLIHPIEYIIFDIGDDPELTEQLFALLIEQSQNDVHSDRIMDNLISIFFLLLVRKYGRRPIDWEQSSALRERYWDMITYIYNNFRTVSLTKTADRFNISTAHCSRLIKEITGKKFTDLVRDIRMKHAQIMLTSSSTRIYDISYFLGYENQETFIRAFKKWYGLSPTQYRNAQTISFSG